MLVAISISPSGRRHDLSDNPVDPVPDLGADPPPDEADGGVSGVVADIVRVIRASGLPNETNAMFTNVEGTLEEVLALIGRCTEYAASVAPRVSVVVKLDVRAAATDALHAKVASVEARLREG